MIILNIYKLDSYFFLNKYLGNKFKFYSPFLLGNKYIINILLIMN